MKYDSALVTKNLVVENLFAVLDSISKAVKTVEIEVVSFLHQSD